MIMISALDFMIRKLSTVSPTLSSSPMRNQSFSSSSKSFPATKNNIFGMINCSADYV